MLSYHIMTEPEKRQVCAWQYDGEYAAYNLPDYTEMQKRQMGFCNPDRRKNFYSYYNNTRLVGFTNLLEEETEVFVGIGVPPSCATKGTADRSSHWSVRLPHSFIRTSLSIWRCGAGTAALLPAISVRVFALKEKPLSRPPRWARAAFTGWFARQLPPTILRCKSGFTA